MYFQWQQELGASKHGRGGKHLAVLTMMCLGLMSGIGGNESSMGAEITLCGLLPATQLQRLSKPGTLVASGKAVQPAHGCLATAGQHVGLAAKRAATAHVPGAPKILPNEDKIASEG